MPKREFSFEQGQPARLVVSWKGRWKNIEVFLDGTKLTDIPDQSALKAGYPVNLPGGTSVVVQMKPGMTAGLDVNWQGKPLPGSSADSVTGVRESAQMAKGIGPARKLATAGVT